MVVDLGYGWGTLVMVVLVVDLANGGGLWLKLGILESGGPWKWWQALKDPGSLVDVGMVVDIGSWKGGWDAIETLLLDLI